MFSFFMFMPIVNILIGVFLLIVLLTGHAKAPLVKFYNMIFGETNV